MEKRTKDLIKLSLVGGFIFNVFVATNFLSGAKGLLALPVIGLPFALYYMNTEKEKGKVGIGGFLGILLIIGPLLAIIAAMAMALILAPVYYIFFNK